MGVFIRFRSVFFFYCKRPFWERPLELPKLMNLRGKVGHLYRSPRRFREEKGEKISSLLKRRKSEQKGLGTYLVASHSRGTR